MPQRDLIGRPPQGFIRSMINRLVCIRQSNDVNGKLDEAKRLWNDEKRLKKNERFLEIEKYNSNE